MKDFKNKLFITFVITLLGTLLMVTTVFFPYATATDDYAENIKDNPSVVVDKDLDITAQDMMNISMVEYANMYNNLTNQHYVDSSYVIYVVLVALIGAFAMLAVIFAFLKKPIAIIIFSLLSFGVFSIQNFDYTDRGIIPSKTHVWGAAYYLFYFAFAIAIAGAVWMLYCKIIHKKKQRQA